MHRGQVTTGRSAAVAASHSSWPIPKILIADRETSPPPEGTGMTELELRRFTTAVKRGDEAAFNHFHELYCLRLYKLLLSLARGRESDAAEVLQVVMIKLTKRFEVFDQEPRLWAWLCSVARNSYVDFYRARQRDHRLVPLEMLGDGLAEFIPGGTELCVAVRVAMEELPQADRELLRAVYLDKRPLMELAANCGQTYKALESRLTRLRQRVKSKFLAHLQNENTPCPRR